MFRVHEDWSLGLVMIRERISRGANKSMIGWDMLAPFYEKKKKPVAYSDKKRSVEALEFTGSLH